MAVMHARCLSTGEAVAIRGDSGPKEIAKSQRKGR